MSEERLIAVEIDDTSLAAPTPEIEQERRVAIFALLEENRFRPLPGTGSDAPVGPYRLRLATHGDRLSFAITGRNGADAGTVQLPLAPFEQVIKDYFAICQSYFGAVRRLPPAEIEAIEFGRRAIHDLGARLVLERLEGRIETDLPTARRLFTLICALCFSR